MMMITWLHDDDDDYIGWLYSVHDWGSQDCENGNTFVDNFDDSYKLL